MWPLARRRSELRTTNMRTILLIALAQAASLAACCELRAESPADSSGALQPPARPTIQKPLTREDAELMLREAHSAIEQGRFDAADKIISRVENAHVQFPFIHTGPTPASLRKELNRADRLRAASKSLSHDQPTGAKKYLPFARSGSSQAKPATDPFAARSRNIDPISAPPAIASQNNSSPAGDRRMAAISAPGSLPADRQTSSRQSVDNPFASSGTPAGLKSPPSLSGEPLSNEPPLSYPSTQASNEETSPGFASPAVRTQAASTPKADAGSVPSWQLPNVPAPRGDAQQFGQTGSGLTPPKRTAANTPPNQSRTPANNSRQQAQRNLSDARK